MTKTPTTSPYQPHELYNQVTYADWQAAATKAIKGADLATLEKVSSDGIEIHPLYIERSTPNAIAAKPSDFAGAWDIRQYVRVTDAKSANAQALKELENGANSVEFEICDENVDFKTLINGIHYDLATIAVDGYELNVNLAKALIEAIPAEKRANALLNFNIGPNSLKMAGSSGFEHDEAFDLFKQYKDVVPKAKFFTADAAQLIELGASRSLQVAFLIACLIDGYRKAEGLGFEVEAVHKAAEVKIGVNQEVFLEVAKIRALRSIWARVAAKIGVSSELSVHAITSSAMMTEEDPYSNVLRISSACFAAGVGGANIITTRPFEIDEAKENDFSRRLARNTQIVLANESNISRVIDPSGGSYAIEALTNDIVSKAWALVQKIEELGGLNAAIHSGFIAKNIGASEV